MMSSIASRVADLCSKGCERLLVIPLYPQYSAATSATVCDEVFRALTNMRLLVVNDREVQKVYLALVNGLVKRREGRIGEPLREFGSGRMGVDKENGKASLTRYRVREHFQAHTLLSVLPLTGRRHQIRVHLYSIGHPIVGDRRYGDRAAQSAYPRLMLHARAITLPMPTGQVNGTVGMRRIFSISSRSSSGSLPSRSSLLMNVMMGVLRARQTSSSRIVCDSTPFTESITMSAASTAVSTRYVSSEKSWWPGVSSRLITWPRCSICITELATEMPRCFSISIQSEVACRVALRAFTLPAIWIAPA